jgi:transposase
VHVIHSSSVAVSREHKRAKTDRLDTAMPMRVYLGWLRGERGHCKIMVVPTLAEEDAKRPSGEHEELTGGCTRAVNRLKAALARLGIRGFNPKADKVDVLKKALPLFATMRSLAMRFRELFRSRNTVALDDWIRDAVGRGIYAMRDAPTNCVKTSTPYATLITERWSNGQTEGQINRLKVLDRAMYGKASVELLCVRMRLLREAQYHQI